MAFLPHACPLSLRYHERYPDVQIELVTGTTTSLISRVHRYDSLQIFKAVVDFGGITKAAAHLNRVQSNITTRVKNLEGIAFAAGCSYRRILEDWLAATAVCPSASSS
jgi:DNA-binding transcriptional LysR family regulator